MLSIIKHSIRSEGCQRIYLKFYLIGKIFAKYSLKELLDFMKNAEEISLLHSGICSLVAYAAALFQPAGDDDLFWVSLFLPEQLHAEDGGLCIFP